MQIQRVNRTDAEKVFIVIKNASSAVITTGYGVRFMGATAAEIATSTDGIQVIATDAASAMPLFAGIAQADIASLGYGLSQVWGYVNSVALSFEAAKTIGCVSLIESYLKWGNAAGLFTSTINPSSLSTYGWKSVVCLSTASIQTAISSYCSGFVRAL
jgi:hypothetical protein